MLYKRLALNSVLVAIALSIFVLELQLPAFVPIPGVKLGLANMITLFALLFLTPRDAMLILLARILLSAFVTGSPSTLLYSLGGGLGCLLAECILLRLCDSQQIWAISGVGAICHNLLQLVCAAMITKTLGVFWYLPVLLLTGTLTGLFNGFCIHFLNLRYGKKLRQMLKF